MPLRRMTDAEIRDEFNAQKTRFETDHAKSGLSEALESLSQAIADIRAQGYDVSLEIFGNPSEQAFGMFQRGGGLTTPVSGVLKSGNNHRLLAFSTKVNGQPALQLAVSEFDIRHNGMNGKLVIPGGTDKKEVDADNVVRAKIYDLKRDPEAMVKFQKDVLFHCARNEAVNDRDVANAFDNGTSIRKMKAPAPKS
jgi:hypothetical protein